MRLIKSLLAATVLLVMGLGAAPAFAGFLQFPLKCSDALVGTTCPSGSIDYRTHGAYTLDAMNSILDHSMAINPLNSYYPYGTTKTSSAGGDLFIKAFNGESASGTKLSTDWRCIGDTINLKPDWSGSGTRMTNDGGCGSNYSSYDEHPGYDYKASYGVPVYAASDGNVISTVCYIGNTGGGNCNDWGAVAIRPTVASGGHDYFYQYYHMSSTVSLVAGQAITAGQLIGYVGHKCYLCTVDDHLHMEVRYIPTPKGPESYPIVDPYGWVGGGTDPLYSSSVVTPANLWQ